MNSWLLRSAGDPAGPRYARLSEVFLRPGCDPRPARDAARRIEKFEPDPPDSAVPGDPLPDPVAAGPDGVVGSGGRCRTGGQFNRGDVDAEPAGGPVMPEFMERDQQPQADQQEPRRRGLQAAAHHDRAARQLHHAKQAAEGAQYAPLGGTPQAFSVAMTARGIHGDIHDVFAFYEESFTHARSEEYRHLVMTLSMSINSPSHGGNAHA